MLARAKNSVLGLQSTKIFNGDYPSTFLTFQRRWNRVQSVPMYVYDDAQNDFVLPANPPPTPAAPAPAAPAQGGNLWARTVGRFWNSPPPHQDIPRQQVDLGQQEPARSMGQNDGPKIKDSGFKPKPDDVYIR